ncbi:hypothetical protein K493DRAFT_371276 [Basidiobolus meristosporus CBS 931.73]|uniref:Uncharacterized protein n=1 Tax=Basidiobolus meristosporus CBS 931.73 TaxID=1314790 RepID=A0A1Y1Z8K0_9FUNG|nr:hypothetical protein K493DRAFT_371276 [Basidiobolus meristosporus CBS 931.73]|eukprot:ORY06434.1 hypothetical protein K493DRAFT_371276 [Basidiobolus meristosporus CBS 931.73]
MSLMLQWFLTICQLDRNNKIQKLQVNEATPEDWEEWVYLQSDGSLGKLPEITTSLQEIRTFASKEPKAFTLSDYAKLEKLYRYLQSSHVDVTDSYLTQLKDHQQKVARAKHDGFHFHPNLEHYKMNTRSSGVSLRGH